MSFKCFKNINWFWPGVNIFCYFRSLISENNVISRTVLHTRKLVTLRVGKKNIYITFLANVTHKNISKPEFMINKKFEFLALTVD